MKQMLNAILLLFIIMIGQVILAQSSNNYKLQIKNAKILGENENNYLAVPVSLINNSNDTLKYFSMSCSWKNLYSVNNSKLKIQQSECTKNTPIIVKIPPKENKEILLNLVISQTNNTQNMKFRIGFNLIKVKNYQDLKEHYNNQNKKLNIVWSNQITVN